MANDRLHQEQLLGLFWEHMPPIDPEEIRRMMLALRASIRELDTRKEQLVAERDALIVQGAMNNRRNNEN